MVSCELSPAFAEIGFYSVFLWRANHHIDMSIENILLPQSSLEFITLFSSTGSSD